MYLCLHILFFQPYGAFVEFNMIENNEKAMEESTWEITNDNGATAGKVSFFQGLSL